MAKLNKGAGAQMQVAFRLYTDAKKALKEDVGLSKEDVFPAVYAVLSRVLERYLDSVQLSWHKDPSKRGWDNEDAEVVVSYGPHIHIPIPLSVLEEKGLTKKVRSQMNVELLKNWAVDFALARLIFRSSPSARHLWRSAPSRQVEEILGLQVQAEIDSNARYHGHAREPFEGSLQDAMTRAQRMAPIGIGECIARVVVEGIGTFSSYYSKRQSFKGWGDIEFNPDAAIVAEAQTRFDSLQSEYDKALEALEADLIARIPVEALNEGVILASKTEVLWSTLSNPIGQVIDGQVKITAGSLRNVEISLEVAKAGVKISFHRYGNQSHRVFVIPADRKS